MVEGFIGIDLAFAKGKRLPVCACRRVDGALVPFALRRLREPSPPRGLGNAAALDAVLVQQFCADVLEYLGELERHLEMRIARVAIDAPSAPCKDASPRREAERAMDRRGISCFATPSLVQVEAIRRKAADHLTAGGPVSRLPHANQLWMLVGFQLFVELSTGYECLEVFPQATARALGVGGVHKRHAAGIQAQLSAVAVHTGWPPDGDVALLREIAFAPLHDCLDAYLAAWVASLEISAREPCGIAPEDVIWLPKITADGA